MKQIILHKEQGAVKVFFTGGCSVLFNNPDDGDGWVLCFDSREDFKDFKKEHTDLVYDTTIEVAEGQKAYIVGYDCLTKSEFLDRIEKFTEGIHYIELGEGTYFVHYAKEGRLSVFEKI